VKRQKQPMTWGNIFSLETDHGQLNHEKKNSFSGWTVALFAAFNLSALSLKGDVRK